MNEKILVPLDGSELAESALPYAEELAAKFNTDVILVYVSELTVELPEDTRMIYLQKIAEFLKQRVRGHNGTVSEREAKIEPVILSGHPAEKIVDYAQAENIGLIIMATHGRSGIKRWALGSVADKVVRATTRPVLLTSAKDSQPETKRDGLFNRMLVLLDGSKEGEAVLPHVSYIASKLKSEVILFQVLVWGYGSLGYGAALSEQQIEEDKASSIAYLKKIESRLREKGITVTPEIRLSSGAGLSNSAEDIIRFAEEKHVDLMAMTTHGRSGVGRYVFGSVTERILHSGNTPLMLVRAPKDQVEV